LLPLLLAWELCLPSCLPQEARQLDHKLQLCSHFVEHSLLQQQDEELRAVLWLLLQLRL